ncbi:cytokinesis protein 3 [Loxospora ochrophaea]|nr:cytokinesis protein 3 [Loxospora ochrophaea]
MNDRYPAISRGHTPVPPSPGAHGLTPSPLRDAMEDVMSSLHDMGLQRDAHSPSPDRSRSPLNPWSPEAFEEFRQKPHSQKRGRPNTSAGISESYGHHSQFNGTGNGYNQSPSDSDDEEPPYLSNYVQRMESRLRSMHAAGSQAADELFLPGNDMGPPPAPPPKNSSYQPRAFLSLSRRESVCDKTEGDRRLRNRKSAYELGRQMVGRTFTTKSSATNSSSGAQSTSTNSTTSTDMTSQSGFSATSAGSLARRKGFGSIGRRRPMSVAGSRQDGVLGLMNGGSTSRPQTPLTSVSYHSSHDSKAGSTARGDWRSTVTDSGGVLGGLTTPKPKKSGFFKKLVDSARTGAASARSSIASGQSEPPRSPVKNLLPSGLNGISGGSVAKDMGMQRDSTAIDWVQVRRDINRSNSLSRNERTERLERCQMLDQPALAPVDALFEIAEGDESLDGLPISEPANFQSANLQLVDKSARFVNSLPPMTNPMSLAQGYVCRPYKSDVQRLRAVFTWVSEKVAWEEDFEGEVDTRRIIQTKRGCAEEVAVLVTEMCLAMGLHAEVVRGYLKVPGEIVEVDNVPQPNHWWNAVLVDGEWRIMDCSLASPTNPKRGQYSSAGSQVAESWWFLARPMEICYTHIPSLPEQQHICPPIPFDVLLALPCACPPYFKNELRMKDYDTSLLFLENLELVNIQFTVPSDVECFAEVEARAFVRDVDGDLFESGDTVTKRALAQAEWVGGQKRFTVKALLPGDEGHGVLKVYAGKRGLMHSIKDNPHPLAFALPIVHTGQNPPYDFLLRHPTPHAQRHDLYVAQPQCARLAINNTFVFAVRQHPSSLTSCSSLSAAAISGAASPLPFSPRPASAMSMTSSSAASSTNNYFSQNHTTTSSQQQQKPAKLAIQAPSGKILRLSRKGDHVVSTGSSGGGGETADGGVWETIIKIGERGTWRGLVLADRSARWCVFGEWECG